MKEEIEHIKRWAAQDHTGLSGRGVADAVMRMCDDALAAPPPQVVRGEALTMRYICNECGADVDCSATENNGVLTVYVRECPELAGKRADAEALARLVCDMFYRREFNSVEMERLAHQLVAGEQEGK